MCLLALVLVDMTKIWYKMDSGASSFNAIEYIIPDRENNEMRAQRCQHE